MGSIYQRTPGGVWYYQWYQGNKLYKKSLKTKNRTEAKRLKVRLDAQVESMKTGLAPKKIRIETAFDKFYKSKEPLLKPGTLLRYREQISFFKSFFEKKNLKLINQLTTEYITDYISWRQGDGRSNKTIQEELNLLRSTMKMLIEQGMMSESPVKRWPKLKTTTRRPERIGFYSPDDIKALSEYFEGKEFYDLFVFFLYTGCRRSEATNLKVHDVHDGMLCIRNIKTESSAANQHRHIEIHKELKDIIAARIENKATDDFVFPEMQRHSRNWPHIEMTKACKKMNVEYRRLHGLRHTFISALLSANVPVRSVMEMVGHENFDTTLRYAHVSQENLKGKIDRLEFARGTDKKKKK